MNTNISILINSLKAGGAERVASVICNNLCEEFNFFIVLLYDDIDYEIDERVTVCRLHQNINESEILRVLKLPFTAYRYYRLCKRNKIKISFSLLSKANFINCFSRMFSRAYKIIISERTNETEYLKQQPRVKAFLQKLLIRLLFPLADMVTTNSKHALLDLKENFNVNLPSCVLYNPVSRESIIFKSKLTDVKNDPSFFNIVCIANFRPEKNHNILVEAAGLLNTKQIKINLIGAGDDSAVRSKARSLGIEDKFIFSGFQSNPFPYIKNADAVLLTSDFEGLPNVVLEALICETPVISTATKGSREILNDDVVDDYTKPVKGKYGILAPVNNAPALARAIDLLYEDKDLAAQYKNKSSQRADDFELKNTLLIMKNIFSE